MEGTQFMFFFRIFETEHQANLSVCKVFRHGS